MLTHLAPKRLLLQVSAKRIAAMSRSKSHLKLSSFSTLKRSQVWVSRVYQTHWTFRPQPPDKTTLVDCGRALRFADLRVMKTNPAAISSMGLTRGAALVAREMLSVLSA